MKNAAVTFRGCLLAGVGLVLAGCFPTRSAELTCDVTSECDDGRVCDHGFCLVPTDAVSEDAADAGDASDADDAAAFDCKKLTTRWFSGCDLPMPGAALDVLSGIATYNTDTGQLQSTAGTVSPPSAIVAGNHVISVDRFTLAQGATLRVIGGQPLIIASWSTLAVAGTIDASSTLAELGAGASSAECTAHASVGGEAENIGGGGGGGGSMLAVGGRGGNGDGSNGGAGGTAVAAAPLLLGGCPGAAGGNGRQAGGVGGPGGGALGLAALESISVTGSVNAAGGGGAGAAGENGGGGGGGSGGMIVLESATVTITGVLAANGGGGGGGSTDNNNATGSPGQAGQLSAARATGGAPNNNGGGTGGVGGAGTTTLGAPGQNGGNDAGGGGGGSTGFIVVAATSSPSMGGTISPAATIVSR